MVQPVALASQPFEKTQAAGCVEDASFAGGGKQTL
jgi:hypothetical protein